jgi:hypothetical protein
MEGFLAAADGGYIALEDGPTKYAKSTIDYFLPAPPSRTVLTFNRNYDGYFGFVNTRFCPKTAHCCPIRVPPCREPRVARGNVFLNACGATPQ